MDRWDSAVDGIVAVVWMDRWGIVAAANLGNVLAVLAVLVAVV